MTSISGLFQGNIFSSADTKTHQSDTASQLEKALASASKGTGGDTPQQLSSYMLDLSEQAKAYLLEQENKAKESALGTATDSFTLNSVEQKQLRDIIAQYKNAPLTQETFDLIQEELTAKGIGAEQLAAKEQVNSFNATQLFLDALNGTQTALSSEQIGASAQTKKENYLTDIIEYWAGISTAESDNVADIDA